MELGQHRRVSAVSYVAKADNPNYVGPDPLDRIAAIVRGAAGPSGPNVEYVLRLAAALRELAVEDPHVFALERLLAEHESRPIEPDDDRR